MRARFRRLGERTRLLVVWSRDVYRGLFEPDRSDLRVAVDITPFWENLTGVGWYLYRLLEHSADLEGVSVRLYGPTLFVDPNDPKPVVEVPEGGPVRYLRFVVPDDMLLPRAVVIRVLRRIEPWLIAAARDRVVFAPNFVVPPKLRKARGALVITIHDRAMRRFPWTLAQNTLDALNEQLDRNVERAAAVITVSETVRSELIEEGEVEADRITAVHHGPGHLGDVAPGDLPLATPDRFALAVGTLEPRKNFGLLLEVWRRLHEARPETPALLLCGGTGWKGDDLHRQLAAGEAEGWVRRVGYVDDPVLVALYRRAELLVYPSLYEGFGLPLVEAMAAGLPTVCSDIDVFREVATDAALYVDAEDVDGWVATVSGVLDDESQRHELGLRARERAGDFDWRRAAQSTSDVWRRVGSPEAAFRGSR